jgi:hypothetical protein
MTRRPSVRSTTSRGSIDPSPNREGSLYSMRPGRTHPAATFTTVAINAGKVCLTIYRFKVYLADHWRQQPKGPAGRPRSLSTSPPLSVNHGDDVLLADLDPQASASAWLRFHDSDRGTTSPTTSTFTTLRALPVFLTLPSCRPRSGWSSGKPVRKNVGTQTGSLA